MSALSRVFRFSERGRSGLEGWEGSQGESGLLYLLGCVALLDFWSGIGRRRSGMNGMACLLAR